MKLVGVISTAVLSLALGAATPAFTQDQREQEEQKAKPAENEKKGQPAKVTKQEEKQQEQNKKPEEKNAQTEKNNKQEDKNAQQEKNTKPEEKNAKQEQPRTQEARPEKQEQHASGGRIPDDRYKANFGREHSFRVSEGDYRNHRFQYGGYWFGVSDPWPSNWLYTQNVYVVEIDGVYYLCNPMYPGVNIVLSVTL
jgi:cell division protein FtsN